MEILVNGKGLAVGDALRQRVDGELADMVGKYFARAFSAVVTFSREAHLFCADISVHPVRGMVVQGHGAGGDAHAAFDSALERIGKQLRRYKRRLVGGKRHRGEEPVDEFLAGQSYIIAPEAADEELPEEGRPVIIAELPTEIATLTVGEAVMRMDLADVPALMFRNRANGGLNVVFRRPDGNIGWIDPANSRLA